MVRGREGGRRSGWEGVLGVFEGALRYQEEGGRQE